MKKAILILLSIIAITNVKSQVANDDCSTAIDLGHVSYWTTGGFGCFNSVSEMDTGLYSASTLNALVNYPYPMISIPCIGYTANISAPANDVWYKISGVTCDLFLIFVSSDTTHLCIWTGANCSVLCPRKCYTLLPNQYIQDSIYSIGSNPLYFQISGPGINKYIQYFHMCLEGSQQNCLGDTTTCMTQYLAINDNELINNFIISPNPTNDRIEIFSPKYSTIEIMNMQGNIIKTILTTNNKTIIDLTWLSSGIYLIKSMTDNGTLIKKLIKQ